MFSDTVQLADINDFITPEQECIIQTGSNVKLDTVSLMDVDISVKVKTKTDSAFGHFNQMLTDKSTNTAKITLDDCLACSGCITSAETVLIKQQSTSQMESYLNTHINASLVVTISNQALIAIAKRYAMSAAQAMAQLSAFFKQEYNAKYVLDTSVALELVLKESIHEFITHYTRNYIVPNHQNMAIDEEEKTEETHSKRLPILTSECPGFVCYAEKSCKASVLQYISALKSPQQVMGLLIKKYVLNSDIYHVTVMPCYDKKLEASRKAFIIDENTKNKEVDCVITSVEIEQLLISKGIGDLSKYPNESCARGDDDVREWIDDCGSDIIADSKGSHGYLENVFMVCGKQLFGIDLELSDLKYKKLRNEDIEELTLCLSEQQMRKLPFRLKDESMIKTGKVLRFLRCYGFRNIQNVVRKIERHKSKYHYIEIMACPFGCLNGGGQIRIGLSDIEAKKIAKQREHIADMRQMLHQIKNINPSVEKVSDVLYKKIMKCNVGENALFKMKLNHVSDDKSKLNINW